MPKNIYDELDQEIKLLTEQIPTLSEVPELRAVVSHCKENSCNNYPNVCDDLHQQIIHYSCKSNTTQSIKFIDLFAGIGGFRQAFINVGCECVFSSEWDEDAKKTYYMNYNVVPFGDIRKINEFDIPDHEVLCAGFPCQPFSIAGVSKKKSMGLATGFEDKIQGTLFFEVCRIIKAKRPKVIFLENVKNLLSHNKSNTWNVIYDTLANSLNYKVFFKIVDGKEWVPQHRERIFIVAFDKNIVPSDFVFDIPEKPHEGYKKKRLKDILEDNPSSKYTLGPGTWLALQKHKERHASKGNGFGFKLLPENIEDDTITSTISARYSKDGAEILIPQKNNRPRKLTVKEAMQLQGYNPECFEFPVGDSKAYKQIGNSVVVPAIQETASLIIQELIRLGYGLGNK